MKADTLIPLIATIAYIPLLFIMLSSRPWQRRQKLCFTFLITALLWSLITFLSRGELLLGIRLIEAKVIFVLFVLVLIQFHYFVSSFYNPNRVRIPLAYVFVIVTIVLTAAGLIPLQNEPLYYGPWVIGIAIAFLVTVGAKDIHCLAERRRLSSDPAERNQIVYILLAMLALAIFLVINVLPGATDYPVSHVGNLLVAGTLMYAVIAYRLLDVRVVFRRAFINLVLYGTGIGIVTLAFWLSHHLRGIEPNTESFVIGMALGIPAILLFAHRVGAPWTRRIEQVFIGERYAYRRRLSQFIGRIHDIHEMQEFGDEFIALVCESVDCRRGCLLLPEDEDGRFKAQFSHPGSKPNPAEEISLKADSPIIAWLRQESSILPVRSLSILPLFRSMWQEERDSIHGAEIEIFVPLVNRGQLAAVLAISQRRDDKPYTVEDIDLLESITAQVAASLEKEYYNQRLRAKDKEIELLNRLTRIVTSSMSIELIFEGFVEELREMVDFDWATITLADGNQLRILALSSNIGSPWESEQRIALEGSATEWVCHERRSVYEQDLTQYSKFVTGKHHLEHGIRSIVYLPLNIKDECIGCFVVASRQRDAFDARKIRLLEQVALQIATPVENSQLYARAEQRSRVDELTGLFNRRHFEERMKEEISKHGRRGDVFSVFLLDLDGFKTYNDIYGHPTGDTLLNQTARLIRTSLRTGDQAFRYGGDEFIVILPDTQIAEARVVAERVRKVIADRMKEKETSVTCSIGLATYPSDGVISGELVTVADTALYFAKRTGGNRVYLPSQVLAEPLEDSGVYARHNGLSTIYALASIVEARDPYTYGHSRRVNTYAVALAEKIGLPPDQVSRISSAALLHDIGKIGVPDKVLNKKGKLNREDWDYIKSHPRLGATIVGNMPNLIPCVSSILHHHERFDGSGYPEGLKGEQISVEARILAIADAFEAMSSARPYRPALSSEKVMSELRRCAGSQFDPELVKVFIGIVEAGLSEKVSAGPQSSEG
jgi:diguanylate cyclase (GGDEF)-like protein